MEEPVHSAQSVASRGAMSAEEQDERRKKIKEIMKDPNLSQTEKSRAIQSLMDGRRRSMSSSVGTQSVASTTSSNYASNMARVAAQAHDYYSDEEGDAIMDDAAVATEDIAYGFDRYDERSVASSVTHTIFQSNTEAPLP